MEHIRIKSNKQTVNLKTIYHLNRKIINSICRPFASFKIEILKVQNFGKFDLSPMVVLKHEVTEGVVDLS